VIESSDIRFNHGIGIHMANGRQVLGNRIHRNGQMGIGGTSHGGLVEGNEIAYNNTAGYDAYWEGGGTKFTYSRNLVLRGNFVHHNNGPGLWTDIDNIDVLIENNRVEDNALSGIFHEISYRATIRDNIVKRNGWLPPIDYYVDGAGILIVSSSDVEIYGNELEDNWQGIAALDAPRGSSAHGPRVTRNLYVHDNSIRTSGARGGVGRTGLESGGNESSYSGQNNRFVRNTYYLGANDRPFFWRGRDVTAAEWQAAGQDTTGIFTR
jgi:parallel beta-helix repeat protein